MRREVRVGRKEGEWGCDGASSMRKVEKGDRARVERT